MRIKQGEGALSPQIPKAERYPLFSFRYLQDDSIRKCADKGFLFQFLTRLRKLSELGWAEIAKSHRHSFGFEYLPLVEFRPAVGAGIVTEDVSKLAVFRATGDNRIFAGVRAGDVFHVIFVETRFGDICPHSGW